MNLGVIETNPSSLAGVIEIMEALHQHVPIIDGKPIPVLCCGDGLSIERMTEAHHTRVTHTTPEERLEGLVEAPQDFHKEMLLLQVYQMLFTSITIHVITSHASLVYYASVFYRMTSIFYTLIKAWQHGAHLVSLKWHLTTGP